MRAACKRRTWPIGLRNHQIAAFYCSSLDRAVETAAIVAKPHGLKLVKLDGLREISHGHWEGMSRKDVEHALRRGIYGLGRGPVHFCTGRRRVRASACSRAALPAIREIVVQHKDEKVLVVSHKATMRLLISSLLGFDARGYRDRLDQAPACLNIVDFMDPVRARLMLFNDISHYAEQPLRPEKHLSKWWDAANSSG